MSFKIDREFTFYFVRHGITDLNQRGLRCGGDLDVPLTSLGRRQARQIGEQVAKLELGVEHIVVSSLARARDTACIVNGVLGGLPVDTEPLLNERSLGAWNGRPIAENEHLLQQGVTPPGGESELEFSARIASALEKLRAHFGRKLLIVSSRGVGRILNTVLGGTGRLGVENGEIIEFSCMAQPAGGYSLRVTRLNSPG